MRRLASLMRKEFIMLRRDKRLLAVLVIVPVIQLLILGSAATTDIRRIRLAVRDRDASFHSREYVRALASSGYFALTALSGPEAADGKRLVDGRAGLVLVIPVGFSRDLSRGRAADVQVLVDGADSNFAVRGMGYLEKATRLFSEGLIRRAAADPARLRGVAVPEIVIESRSWFNPDHLSRYYMVPAVMGVLLLVTTMVATSMALVKEREEGTLEQVMVTPLRRTELILGKLLPFACVGLAEVTLAIVVTVAVFRVPLRGSVALLYGFSALFLLSTLGLGLFISTLVKTQQQAMMVAVFFVMMPFILLAGFVFPVPNMPAGFRVAAEFIPMKHYLTAVREIYLKGTPARDLAHEALALAAWGAVILGLAVAKFRKRLD